MWPSAHWTAALAGVCIVIAALATSPSPSGVFPATPAGNLGSALILLFALLVCGFVAAQMLWRGGAIRRGRVQRWDVTLQPEVTVELGTILLKPPEVLEVWAVVRKPALHSARLRIDLLASTSHEILDSHVFFSAPRWLFRNRRRPPEHVLLDHGLRNRECRCVITLLDVTREVTLRVCAVPTLTLRKLARTCRTKRM